MDPLGWDFPVSYGLFAGFLLQPCQSFSLSIYQPPTPPHVRITGRMIGRYNGDAILHGLLAVELNAHPQACSWVFDILCKKKTVYSCLISARPRPAEYTIGICFETGKNTKAFECFFTGFQHSLWKFSATGNRYSLKSWLWLAAIACVVCWPISNALLNDIWLTHFYI